MSDQAKWYVIHTYSGYENKVASSIEKAVENRNLHEQICAVSVPTKTVVEVKKDAKGRTKTYETKHKIYPGYVLVKMVLNDETWYLVRNTRGCTGFVGQDKSGGSKPVPLTEDELDTMGIEPRTPREDEPEDNRLFAINYEVGDSVRIIDGPLQGSVGVVAGLAPERDCVQVKVLWFGRETTVELTLGQVEVLED